MSTGATPEPIAAPEQVELSFPDLPRLELDQLLGQLVERAQEVMATQGRLRGLLKAVQLIIGDLDLPTVLRHIAEAARELVGARYAALGVIAPDGRLAQFVTTPSVHFSGPLDALADDLVDDLISVLHGTLSALAQQPEHRLIDIAVTADERITLEITDPYGSVPDPTAVDTGMRERAAARGGTFTRAPQHPAGTALCWTVPNPR